MSGDKTEKKEKLNEAEQWMKCYLKGLELHLKSRRTKYYFGDTISIADFDLAAFAYAYIYNEHLYLSYDYKEMLKNYPNVKEYYKDLGKEMKDYLSKRPACPW
mmetsp:Transcript_22995/g.17434  ORF Transcript_22995/g.17434 Transcript_22995/m.17434 type:complete len:103 (+) Transcript_22995:734-1042(+)